MPLEQRVIAPIGVGRGCVPMDAAGNLAINIPNELECVTNGTLANIIRQLSSLSDFAEDLFASIVAEASVLLSRSSGLQTRIDRLATKVLSLDSSVEEVSLQDIHLRKAFKSSVNFDQKVVSRDTIPKAIHGVYRRCDCPPPLQKLNPYRDDGKDGLKFYTDPNYFFELWRQEMLADTEKALADRSGRKLPRNKHEAKKQKKVRPPANSRERFRQMVTNSGEFILYDQNSAENGFPRPQSLEVNPWDQRQYHQEVLQMNEYNLSPPPQSTPTRRHVSNASRPSQPPPAPPSAPPTPNRNSELRSTLPPPPPPPPDINGQKTAEVCPPPPPPPPPSVASDQRPRLPTATELQSIQLKKIPETVPAVKDARSDLLAAIREGIKLKRVEDNKAREVEKSTPLHDVASILARRVAIELSDSEGGAEDEEDSDQWDDESEC